MTQRKVYLTFVAVFFISLMYLAVKFFMADWKIKLLLLSIAATIRYVAPLRSLCGAQLNKWYHVLVYENSTFWELFYDAACILFPSAEINQINYGFAPLTEDGVQMSLPSQDEKERMSLQLYYRTATCLMTAEDLRGKTILEVSSGRGGGLDFLVRNYGVQKGIGLDLSSNNIDWCKKTYQGNDKLEFVLGNAETFVDDGSISPNSVDIVISVDSAHLYPHFDRFINQSKKVLKAGGSLCISDFMSTEKIPLREQVLKEEPDMKLVRREETTRNILHAMDLDGERRKKLVEAHAHPILKHYFRWQTGAKGSRIYNLLTSGEFSGAGWVLEKTA